MKQLTLTIEQAREPIDPHQRAYLIELMAEQAIKDRQRNREQTAFNKWRQQENAEFALLTNRSQNLQNAKKVNTE